MAIHPFHQELAKLRLASRWPDMEEFASQVGMSFGGYRKVEIGARIPEIETLKRILNKSGATSDVASRLLGLRDDAKASQVGIRAPLGLTPAVDCEALSKRIRAEIVFVLKQSGVDVKDSTRAVMERRVAMILKSVLGG